MADATDFYDKLGISQNASEEDIRSAFHRAARKLHPDVNVNPGATEMFLGIKEAYEVLSNADKRAQYDGKIGKKKSPPLPVRVNIIYSRTELQRMDEPQLVYAMVNFDILPNKIGVQDKSSPLNVSIILDSSTSMKGSRLDVVKHTALEIIRHLRDDDILSIVTFNDKAEILLPAGPRINLRKIESDIRKIQTRGGTEIAKGIEAGLNEVTRFSAPNMNNHMILITDGKTYGDEAISLQLAQQASKLGVGISGLGIGTEWNDDFLDSLATITGGSTQYVVKAQDIRKFLKDKFQDLEQTLIPRIDLEFQTGTGVNLRYAFRLRPEAGVLPIGTPIRLGTVPVNSGQRILLEFKVNPIHENIDTILLMNGEFNFDIPSISDNVFRIPISLIMDATSTHTPKPPPAGIVKAMSKLTLFRMQEQAKLSLQDGNVDEASEQLQNLASRLLSEGNQKLATTVMLEAEKVRKSKIMSQEGQKAIKYGTRSLLRTDILFEDE